MLDPKKDYYKPIRTVNAFNNNYIQYEIIGDKNKTLTVKEYLDMIRSYLSDIINDHKARGEWKIHLTIASNFISSKDSEKTHTMHSKSDKAEIMIGNETDEIIEKSEEVSLFLITLIYGITILIK